MIRSILLIAGCCCAFGVRAQWGVRFTVAEFARMSSLSPLKWQTGLGVDFDTSPRTSFGCEFLFAPGTIELPLLYLQEGRRTYDAFMRQNTGDIGYYSLSSSSCFGVQLRSAYFFTDNSEAAGYVAIGLGVRHFSADMAWESEYDNGGTDIPFPGRISGSRMVVPFTLRVGARGDLRQLWSDVYFGLGYQIGAGPLFDEKYPVINGDDTTESDEVRMTGFTLNFGWSIGFGGEGGKNTAK